MGLIARQAGAPIADGENPSGTEVEAEFSTVFTVINGNLDNNNVKTGAGISGAKLGIGSTAGSKVVNNAVTGAKVADNTVTTGEIEAAAVTQAFIDTDTGTETMTTSGTFVDVPGVTSWTVTPGSTNNFIHLELLCYVADGTAGIQYSFGFSIDGMDTAALASFDVQTGSPDGWYVNWMVTASAATSMVIKPVYARSAGASTSTFSTTHVAFTKIFRGLIIPV